jgi:MOSC domain-containing protein YiiM
MNVLAPIVAPRSMNELRKSLPHIAAAPKDEGVLDLIVVRPDRDKRETPASVRVTRKDGVVGDHWITGSGLTNKDGTGLVDAQICMMMSRVIEAVAGPIENWAPAGDNLFIDMDLTPSNMPPGTRFAIGTAEFEVTPEPHNGCQRFIDRYGRDAVLFVNVGEGKALRLRGIYARVTVEGEIARGDTVRKLP